MSISEKLSLLVKTSRPIFWIVGPIIFLIGLRFNGQILPSLSFVQIVLMSFPYCIFVYGINDIHDYESDKINKNRVPVRGFILKPKNYRFIKNTSLVVVVLLIFSSLLTFNYTNVIGMSILLFFSYFYSSPPLRFKEVPVLDSLSNGMLYFFGPFLIGFSYGADLFSVPSKIYFIVLAVSGFHAFSTIIDFSSDKKAGYKTFSTVLGKRVAALFALATFIITLFFAGVKTPILNYYLLFCTSVFFITLIKPNEKLALLFAKLIFLGFVISGIIYLSGLPSPPFIQVPALS